MPLCPVCGREIGEEVVVYYYDCGRPLCEDCQILGLCPDCEEEDWMDEELEEV